MNTTTLSSLETSYVGKHLSAQPLRQPSGVDQSFQHYSATKPHASTNRARTEHSATTRSTAEAQCSTTTHRSAAAQSTATTQHSVVPQSTAATQRSTTTAAAHSTATTQRSAMSQRPATIDTHSTARTQHSFTKQHTSLLGSASRPLAKQPVSFAPDQLLGKREDMSAENTNPNKFVWDQTFQQSGVKNEPNNCKTQ